VSFDEREALIMPRGELAGRAEEKVATGTNPLSEKGLLESVPCTPVLAVPGHEVSPPKVLLPPPHFPRRAELLQEWDGRVLAIANGGKELVALLRDLTVPSNPEEEITLDMMEVSEGDRPLVLKGALFYWTIGYEYGPGGQLTRFSRIRFRRIPSLSRRELDAARQEGERLAALFGYGASAGDK